ncbi:MAG: S8 family serine peptidase [Pseudomonadota bacterium]
MTGRAGLAVARIAAVLLVGLLAACSAATLPSPAADRPAFKLISARQTVDARHLIVTIEGARETTGAEIATELARAHGLTLVAEWPLASIDVHCLVFRAPDSRQRGIALASLAADPRVRTVQPMQRFETLAGTPPDANLEGLQPGLAAMGLPAAHALATGRDVRVALVDTAPDTQHFELSESLASVHDLVGTEERIPTERHATALAGVIAAEVASGRGVRGVAPDARLIALRACWEDEEGAPGQCSSFSLARALNLAIAKQVDIINLSLAGPPDPLLIELVEAALAADIVVVGAWSADAGRAFPGTVEGVLPVGTPADPALDGPALVAPALDVLTTAPGGGFDFVSGRSVATAHVTGLVALIRELRPSVSGAELKRALATGAGATGAPRHANACAALITLGIAQAPGRCGPQDGSRAVGG